MLRDRAGKPWAHKDRIKEGDTVKADGGFTCIAKDASLTVKSDPAKGDEFDSLYIDCRCEETAKHFLNGQADEDGALIGLYHTHSS